MRTVGDNLCQQNVDTISQQRRQIFTRLYLENVFSPIFPHLQLKVWMCPKAGKILQDKNKEKTPSILSQDALIVPSRINDTEHETYILSCTLMSKSQL